MKEFKTILKCVGIAFTILFSINLLSFLFSFILHGAGAGWNFQVMHGVFYLDEQVFGLKLWESDTNGFLFFLFIAALSYEVRMRRLNQLYKSLPM